MEGFEKGLFPSKSIAIPKFSPPGSVENNENDSSQEKLIPKFQNNKKSVAKHFMSPTISAASKAAAPRKKILAERIENSSFCDAQNHKKSYLDLKKSPRNLSVSHSDGQSSPVVSSYDVSEPEDDCHTKLLDDSSVKVYDPLTNYLTPRPKYLRFNPNRRREIFTRLERECREELHSSFDYEEMNDEVESSAEEIEDSSLYCPNESVVKPQNGKEAEENDKNIVVDSEEEVEEEEELEEKRGWCLGGVLKLLFTLIACFLSTSYICSMNSSSPSPTQQAIWHIKDGCLTIKKQTVELISTRMDDAGFFEMEVGDNDSEVGEVEIGDDNNGEIEESDEAEMVEEDDEYLERHEKELVRNENENSKDEIDKAEELAGVRAAEFEFEPDNEQVIAAKTDETIDGGSFCLEKHVESSFMGLNEDKVYKTEAAGSEIIRVDEVKSETQSSEQLIGAKTDESEDTGGYEPGMEIEVSSWLQDHELPVKSLSGEMPKESKSLDNTESLEELMESVEELQDSLEEIVESHEKLTDSVNEDEIGYDNEVETRKVGWHTSAVESLEELTESVEELKESLEELVESHEKLTDSVNEDEIGYDNEVETRKVGRHTSAVIGVFVVSILSALLAIIHHSKKARNTAAEESEPVLKPHKFAVEEKVTPVLPSLERKIEFLARPSLPSHSMDKAPKELNHHIHAPTVELIGEIVVGQVSNLRSSQKYQKTESEERNPTVSPKHGSIPQPVSATAQPSAVEHSTVGSPSYGSCTTETKILKKEGGQSGEAKIGVTPVRRSSRLRNRAAVTSP